MTDIIYLSVRAVVSRDSGNPGPEPRPEPESLRHKTLTRPPSRHPPVTGAPGTEELSSASVSPQRDLIRPELGILPTSSPHGNIIFKVNSSISRDAQLGSRSSILQTYFSKEKLIFLLSENQETYDRKEIQF